MMTTEHKRRPEPSLLDHGTLISNTTTKRHKSESSISAKERKEKIGERIVALQQLVSPFGKTDTTSVLTEAMEYISFLQDQVKITLRSLYQLRLHYRLAAGTGKVTLTRQSKHQVLSAPYLQNTSLKNQESQLYSLRSRGLCLMPISCTLCVARSNGADLWAPIKGSSPKM